MGNVDNSLNEIEAEFECQPFNNVEDFKPCSCSISPQKAIGQKSVSNRISFLVVLL